MLEEKSIANCNSTGTEYRYPVKGDHPLRYNY